MKIFSLDSRMTAAIGGGFYPTGHSMVMFPKADDAQHVGQRLREQGFDGDVIYLIPPEVLLAEITPTGVETDNPLPSAGTEGATVRAYTELAREGHTGLLVATPNEAAAERLMQVVRTVPYAMAQRYRRLVIEDL